MSKSTLGGRLKKLRSLFGLSHGDVAEFLGMDRSTYCCYEIGRAKPDICNLARLARLYWVSTDYLLHGEPEPEFVRQYEAQAGAPRLAEHFREENLLTLSGQERRLIAQFRLLPNRNEILEEVHRKCAAYLNDCNDLFPVCGKKVPPR